METYKCLNCGKEFQAKKSAKRKFCCRECSNQYSKGKERPSQQTRVKVTCANCGKVEYVTPCRAKNYVCCCTKCSSEYRKNQHTNQIKCICPVCKAEFWMKPYRVKRVKTQICCSKECSNKLRETTFCGENNHQYGLIGDKNSSFKGKEIISNLGYILEYCPGHPRPCDNYNKASRVRQHRLVIERNYKKFDPKYFEEIDGWVVLKEEYDVHHINEIKTDNRLENLQILSRSEHTILHNKRDAERSRRYKAIVGVIKQGELLETPEVDNQQPSWNSNIPEGSTTNSQIQTDNAEDSNVDTSALLQQIKAIVDEDIV